MMRIHTSDDMQHMPIAQTTNAVMEVYIREAYVAICQLLAVAREEMERDHEPLSTTARNRVRELAPLAIALEQLLTNFE
ncbi:hypothetical protein NS183_05740 [Microbacterium testaceum]|nr:hypothetical protein NS183_05740 [Microbacterium testaceum]